MVSDQKIFYRRRLPHYQPPNEAFHVTFRLTGSIPFEVFARLKTEQAHIQKRIRAVKNSGERKQLHREWSARYFGVIDDLLGMAAVGPRWLEENALAAVVAEAIQMRDGTVYDLLAYSVLPNHVHLLVKVERGVECLEPAVHVGRASARRGALDDRNGAEGGEVSDRTERPEVRSTTAQYILTDVLRALKGSTAYECNRLLNRRGAFWQHESYDHVVRDDAELNRTVRYVIENPVKAALCKSWRDWNWSYVKQGLIEV